MSDVPIFNYNPVAEMKLIVLVPTLREPHSWWITINKPTIDDRSGSHFWYSTLDIVEDQAEEPILLLNGFGACAMQALSSAFKLLVLILNRYKARGYAFLIDNGRGIKADDIIRKIFRTDLKNFNEVPTKLLGTRIAHTRIIGVNPDGHSEALAITLYAPVHNDNCWNSALKLCTLEQKVCLLVEGADSFAALVTAFQLAFCKVSERFDKSCLFKGRKDDTHIYSFEEIAKIFFSICGNQPDAFSHSIADELL